MKRNSNKGMIENDNLGCTKLQSFANMLAISGVKHLTTDVLAG